jgi:hypothetical protein
MKKITMLIIAAFIVITSANSQTTDKIFKAVAWVYNNEEWQVVERSYPDNMYITMEGNDITISNESNSRFITYGDSRKENTDRYESYTWDAYDENHKKCIFSITKYFKVSGYSVFALYEKDHVAVQYIITEK